MTLFNHSALSLMRHKHRVKLDAGWIGLFSVAILTFLAAAQHSQANEFLQPEVSESREFTASNLQHITAVRTQGIGVPIWIFDAALEKCQASPEQLAPLIESAFTSIDAPLRQLFPNWKELLVRSNPIILLDSLTASRASFRSFFFPQFPPAGEAVIVLDCTPSTRAEWTSVLAHEIVHALSTELRLDSWFEEGLAQLIEVEAGGTLPRRLPSILQASRLLPPLLETSRPLPSNENYALSYLFVSYLHHHFGGWPTLQKITQSNSPELRSMDFFTRISTLAAQSMNELRLSPSLTQLTTREGLLQLFFVALALNGSSTSIYSIPGWRGFSSAPISFAEAPGQLAASQFVRLTSNLSIQSLERVNPDLKLYRIMKWSNQEFKVLTREASGRAAEIIRQKGSPQLDFWLLINISNHSMPVSL